MRNVRYSELASYRRCPRQWYLSWFRNKTSKTYATNASLLEGSATHAGIEAYNRGIDIDTGILDYTHEKMMEVEDDESLAALTDAASAASIYLEAFPEWAEGEGLHDVGKETVLIEERVHLPLPETGVTITGTVDRAVRDDAYGGSLVIEDYKTAGDFRNRPIQADAQLLTYALALGSTRNEPVRAGRHIRIKKNKRTARANPPFFDTHDNVYTEQQLHKHLCHTVVWASKMEESRNMLLTASSDEGEEYIADYAVPPSPGFHCTSPACPMLDVCNAMDDGSDWRSILEENFQDREPDIDDVIE